MQVTIGAKCWDGTRSKSLSEAAKTDELVKQPTFWDKARKHVNDPRVMAILSFSVPVALLASGLPPIGLTHAFVQAASVMVPGVDAVPVMAAISGTTKETIMHAFDPLINLIQFLSYPIAGVMIAGGCLFIMVGNRENGMKMLQNAALGYILVQLSPLLLKLLVGIGSGM